MGSAVGKHPFAPCTKNGFALNNLTKLREVLIDKREEKHFLSVINEEEKIKKYKLPEPFCIRCLLKAERE
ncbi:MAG: hypothetical protein ACLT0Y_09010, partial [Christensenellales bacterium]